ncbi:Uncharacterised protein [Candidatus Bartonella washoeensis]|nr:Uncharacterised protein [Bartonella washoeensis]
MIDNGTGNHKITVSDSGREITPLFSQTSSFTTQLNLVTDRSQNEGANFTLENHLGKEITTIDGGTYIYSLYKKEMC